MKTVLVTGGAGFVGSHLCEKLLERGKSVLCLDNLISGDSSNLEGFRKHTRFKFINHDITQPISFGEPIDEIYNLACPASPIDYQNFPLETLLTSSLGVKNMLDLAVEKKAKFLHTSTSEVYGDPLEHPQKESYFGNVNPIGPRSCYDEGKRFAESLIINYGIKFNLNVKIVRIFNTYGPRMRLSDGRVISNFLRQALAGDPLTIDGDGSQTRSFCYVSDMVGGLLAMMESGERGPINLGNPSEFTVLELAKLVKKLANSSSRIVFRPRPVDDPNRRRPDISLAKQRLGWSPKVALEEGLRLCFPWFKKNLGV